MPQSFYDERGGWKPFPSDEVLIEVGNTSSNCQNGIRDDLQLLRKDDIAQICSLDVSLMQAEVIKRPLGKGIAVRAAVLPGYDLALWYFGSEEYTGKIATGKSPEIKGAKAGDVAIYWIHEFKRRQLMILRVVDLKIRSNDDSTLTEENRVQSLASVLAAGVKEAKEWDLGAVVVWNPDEGVKKAAEILGRDMDGVKPVVWERDTDNFPALRWKQEDNAGKVEWWCVEKYTWC